MSLALIFITILTKINHIVIVGYRSATERSQCFNGAKSVELGKIQIIFSLLYDFCSVILMCLNCSLRMVPRSGSHHRPFQ